MSFSETKENPVCVFPVQVMDLLFPNSEREVGGRKNEVYAAFSHGQGGLEKIMLREWGGFCFTSSLNTAVELTIGFVSFLFRKEHLSCNKRGRRKN